MVINTFRLKSIENLAFYSRKNTLKWISLDSFKRFLLLNKCSFNSIKVIHEYLVHLNNDHFIFDCSYSFISVFENCIYILSKSKQTFNYRIDKLIIDSSELKWEKLDAPLSLILRLRNSINCFQNVSDSNVYDNLILIFKEYDLF